MQHAKGSVHSRSCISHLSCETAVLDKQTRPSRLTLDLKALQFISTPRRSADSLHLPYSAINILRAPVCPYHCYTTTTLIQSVKMSTSPLQYIPSTPSPLNPTTYDTSSPTPSPSPTTKPSRSRPRLSRHQTSPTLSYAQHILRAKTAEAWRTQQILQAYQPNRPDPEEEEDISDCPLTHTALGLHHNQNYIQSHSQHHNSSPNAQGAVDLENSLGLDPISPVSIGEKPGFGLLQPFTVDLGCAAEAGNHIPEEERKTQWDTYRSVAKRALVILATVGLYYGVLPGMRTRATFKDGLNS